MLTICFLHVDVPRIDLREVRSVTEFQRNAKAYVGKLKDSKTPFVLTVNGRAEPVVQDATSYQDMLDRLAKLEDLPRFGPSCSRRLGGLRKLVPADLVRQITVVNGEPGVVSHRNGKPFAVTTIEYKDGLVHAIYVVTNPDKLAHIPSVHHAVAEN